MESADSSQNGYMNIDYSPGNAYLKPHTEAYIRKKLEKEIIRNNEKYRKADPRSGGMKIL